MKNYNGLRQSSELLENHEPFDLYFKNEYFSTFEYDEELKRYQSDRGYLTIKKVYEIAKDMEQDRKIKWN